MSHDDDEKAAEILGEFGERRLAGESVNGEDLVRDHPDLADELRAGLEAVRRLGKILPKGGGKPGASASRPPARIGGYRIVREIGRGGMGVVYEAIQDAMRRKVALKVLYPSFTNTAKSVERFQREARAAGKLQHTNIVTVHQLGEDRGVWFCAMELVQGRALDAVLDDLRAMAKAPKRGGRGARRKAVATTGAAESWQATTGTARYYQKVAEMFAEVAEALQYAHDQGVVHRDVKPANLMLSADGRIKILDFGLARMREEQSALTVTGGVVGTPSYMSPEQAKSGEVDARTDVYALGASLYEILALRPPFEGKDTGEVLRNVLAADPVSPRKREPRVPRDLETIVLKALEKEPAKRYATADDMARDLRAFADDRGIAARRVSPLMRAWRLAKRHKVRTGLAAGLLVAAVVAVALAAHQSRLDAELAQEQAQRVARDYDDLLSSAVGSIPSIGSSRANTWDIEILAEPQADPLGQAIALDPQRPDAYLWRAIQSRSGSPDLGPELADLEAASRRGLPDATYRLARACVFREVGRKADSELELAKVAPGQGQDAVGLCLRAAIADADGRARDALTLFQQALSLPDDTLATRWALRRRFRLRERLGDDVGAMQDLTAMRALRDRGRSPSSPRAATDAWLEVAVARVLERLGQPKDAEAILRGQLDATAQAKNEQAWIRLCVAFDGRDLDFEILQTWRLECTRRALDEFPRSVDLLILRAAALSRSDPAAGVALCDRAIAVEPGRHGPHCMKAGGLLELRRYEDAVSTLAEATRLAPAGCGYTHDRLARAHFRLGHTEEAFREYRAAQELLPEDPWIAEHYAFDLALAGRHGDALVVVDRAIAANGADPDLRTRRALILDDVGRLEEALSSAKEAARLAPRYWVTQQTLGSVLLSLLRVDEALTVCERAFELAPEKHGIGTIFATSMRLCGVAAEARLAALDRDPDLKAGDPIALIEHAYACSDEENFEGALSDLAPVLAVHPNCLCLVILQARWLEKLGRHDDAIAAYRRALTADATPVRVRPDFRDPAWRGTTGRSERSGYVIGDRSPAGAHLDRAEALSKLGQIEEAQAELQRGVDADPSDPLVALTRVALFRRMGKLSEALAEAERLCIRRPNDQDAHLARARLFLQSGRPHDALRVVDESLRRWPDEPVWHWERGQIFCGVDQYQDARREIECALTLHEAQGRDRRKDRGGLHQFDAALARGLLAEMLALCGRMDEALAQNELALRANPRQPQVLASRGSLLRAVGRLAESQATLEAALDVVPFNAYVTANLASTLLAEGDREGAQLRIDEVLDSDPRIDTIYSILVNALAWGPNRPARDPEAAVALGRKAVEVDPTSSTAWECLAAALCAAKEWDEALAADAKCSELKGSDGSSGWFTRAIAHHGAGHGDEARRWYDRGVEWMRANAPGQPELERFRVETAEALGIDAAATDPKLPKK